MPECPKCRSYIGPNETKCWKCGWSKEGSSPAGKKKMKIVNPELRDIYARVEKAVQDKWKSHNEYLELWRKLNSWNLWAHLSGINLVSEALEIEDIAKGDEKDYDALQEIRVKIAKIISEEESR